MKHSGFAEEYAVEEQEGAEAEGGRRLTKVLRGAQSFEHALANINKLNRSLEAVITVRHLPPLSPLLLPPFTFPPHSPSHHPSFHSPSRPVFFNT